MQISDNEKQLIFVVILLAVVGIFYARSIRQEIARGEENEKLVLEYQEEIKPFLGLVVQAKSFAVYDVDENKFVYKRNAELPLPLASLSKVMSAVVILENSTPEDIFEIEKADLGQAGDNGLLVKEKWRRDDLLRLALVASSNDAIHAMARIVGAKIDPETENPIETFVQAMNTKAENLGFHNSNFENETGLDLSVLQNGAYASARDMAKLFAYAVEKYPEIFSATKNQNFKVASFDQEHIVANTNPLVSQIAGILASKTGFTNISGGNLAIALSAKNGHKMVVVLLGSTFDDRFVDIKTLSGAVLNTGGLNQ